MSRDRNIVSGLRNQTNTNEQQVRLLFKPTQDAEFCMKAVLSIWRVFFSQPFLASKELL
jgi:hypothetical protein